MTAISGPTVSASFAYDAFGRRISKTINGQSTNFLYDGLDIVGESGTNGEVTYLRTLAIDEALSRTDATGTLAYLADAIGSTLVLADATGNLSTTYSYAPFGGTALSGPSMNPFQFTGRENDGTGLYYYRARYHDPTRNRFTAEDPIGLSGGDTNFYVYTANSPISHVDAEGLQLWPINCGLWMYYEWKCLKTGLECKEELTRRCRDKEDRIPTPSELVTECYFRNPTCIKAMEYGTKCGTAVKGTPIPGNPMPLPQGLPSPYVGNPE